MIHAIQRNYTDGVSVGKLGIYLPRQDRSPFACTRRTATPFTADNDSHLRNPFTDNVPYSTPGTSAVPVDELRRPRDAKHRMGVVIAAESSRSRCGRALRARCFIASQRLDLCYANLNPTAQPAVWAEFGNNVQRSAAHRPWMPCPGNHEIEFCNGEQGSDFVCLTRDDFRERDAIPGTAGTASAGRLGAVHLTRGR